MLRCAEHFSANRISRWSRHRCYQWNQLGTTTARYFSQSGGRLRAALPVETPFSDRDTSHPIMAKTPRLLFSPSPRLFLSRPRYSTLEFADVGIMRPQPVNNETKDVAHQLRSIYCLASISSAQPPPPSTTHPCVFSLRGCLRCRFSVVVVGSACAPKTFAFENMKHKSLQTFGTLSLHLLAFQEGRLGGNG